MKQARSSHVIWDSNGERLYAEPSHRDTGEQRARVMVALDEAAAALSPLGDSVHGELQAVRAVHPGLDNWCAWVERATNALTAKWRGEDAEEPPEPPPVAVEPKDDPHARQLSRHADLLDSARPWARVDHRRYDEPLYRRLCDAMQVCAWRGQASGLRSQRPTMTLRR